MLGMSGRAIQGVPSENLLRPLPEEAAKGNQAAASGG